MPWLMGLSAGGKAGFQVIRAEPEAYRGYVCLVSAPMESEIPLIPRRMPILTIAGKRDLMAPIEIVREQIRKARIRNVGIRLTQLEGSHFILLSEEERVFSEVRSFLNLPKIPISGGH